MPRASSESSRLYDHREAEALACDSLSRSIEHPVLFAEDVDLDFANIPCAETSLTVECPNHMNKQHAPRSSTSRSDQPPFIYRRFAT